MNSRLKHTIDIVIVLIQKDLKVRYKNSVLGYFWSIAHPLAFAFVFYIAFKIIVKIPLENYALFLICGLFPWQWFTNSVNASPMIFLGNAPLIKRVNFPRNLLPFTLVLQDMIHFLLSLPVIILFLLMAGKTPSYWWLVGIPILLVSQFLLTYGICLIIASVNLFFRDLERLTTIVTTVIFYVTPIFYPASMIPDRFLSYMNLNPLAAMVSGWRNLFLNGHVDIGNSIFAMCYGILLLAIGTTVYRKLSWRFAEVL